MSARARDRGREKPPPDNEQNRESYTITAPAAIEHCWVVLLISVHTRARVQLQQHVKKQL